MLKLVILGRPVTKKNHNRRIRRGNKTFTVPSEAYEKWNNYAQNQLARQMQGVIQPRAFGVNMRALVYRGAKVGDLVNYLQAIQDTLQECGAVADDKWILALDGSRLLVDYENPRVEIELTPVAS